VGGAARCWGGNTWGNLGNGTTDSSSVAVQVTGLSSGVTSISASDTHACALTTSGQVLCWGQGFFGELGNGAQTDVPVPIPGEVVGLPPGILAVAAGGQHTCALTAERTVLCWGKNGFGELGNGTTVDSLVPVAVLGLAPGVLSLSAGANGTCAITASGALRCWGLNYAGVIGSDANSKSAVAVDSTGLSSGIIEVSVGQFHACALSATGKVLCWGLNGTGQLGSPLVSESAQPLEVAGLPASMAGIAAGFSQSCAFTAGGELRFWGDGGFLPTTINGLSSGVVAVAASNNAHQCVVMSNGGVKCWGQNQSGQLGDGSTTASAIPVDVKGL
jgi:alpha-tubulin suppressor-like RCC1 family protein